MARTPLFTLLTATLFTTGLMAATAHAENAVVVQVAGRTHSQVVADIAKAARRVCADTASADFADDFDSQDDCVSDTVSITLSKLANISGR